MQEAVMLLPFRAKIKVRYAMLLITMSGLFVFTVVKSGCCDDLFNKAESVVNRGDVIADVMRRSLSAKWHDSRELLNKNTNTVQKNEEIMISKVRRGDIILQDEIENIDILPLREETIRIKFNLKDLSDEEKEMFKHSEDQRPNNFNKVNPTPASELSNKNRGKFFGGNSENNKNNVENTFISEEELKVEVNDETNVDSKKDNILEEEYSIKKRNSSKAVWELGVNRLNNETEQNNGEADDENSEQYYINNDSKGNEYNKDKENEQANEDDDDTESDDEDDLQQTNLTIFDPNEGKMTYYVRDVDYDLFVKSQINESRIENTQWAKGFPLTPEEAIIRYGQLLPPWEQYEIFHYPKIYYLGIGSNKTQLTSNSTNNFGFDYDAGTEKEGHYRVKIGDHIGYRYEVLEYLGSGTFGAVVLARDWSNPTARNVAIKLMHLDENEKYFMREVKLMKYIENHAANHDYFSRMISSFKFRNHWCLVLDLLGHSVDRHFLGSPIRDISLLRRFADDIIKAMFYLQQLNIVHGDLKPDNIMYIYGKNNNSNGQLLKVADFGIGCIPQNDDYHCPSYYIQTRYYRAPEVILSLPVTTQVDMFSVGVILAEFFLGVPPFFGETETDQLAAMMEVLGLPPTYMIANAPRKRIYSKAICYTTENGFHRKPYRKPLTKVLKGMDPALFDLIARCLEYDPKLRITPAEALHHPFLTGVYPAIGLQEPILIKRLLGKV